MAGIRRKGVSIVEMERGILLVAGRKKIFSLPGGKAEVFESRKRAAIRELYEETCLKVKKIKYLFSHLGKRWHNYNGKLVKNSIKVFLVKTLGIPSPNNEIKYISFWKPGIKLRLSDSTKIILKKYLSEYK
jgi:8-oxo-dGTP pyrophosphatase MutT (NUDIX family)